MKKSDGYIVDCRGQPYRRKTTKGGEFEVKWKDGTSSWIPLSDLKKSNPVEIANYSRSNKIDKEPAFGWWVPYTLKKAKAIISAVQSRTRKTNRKYGIEIPRNVDEVTKLDAKNGDTYWHDAVNKEMRNVAVAYQVMEENERAPNDHIYVGFHMVYDVKMNFTRKARLVADGHKTLNPAVSTYTGVVSHESVRIAFLYAALNGLGIMAADI